MQAPSMNTGITVPSRQTTLTHEVRPSELKLLTQEEIRFIYMQAKFSKNLDPAKSFIAQKRNLNNPSVFFTKDECRDIRLIRPEILKKSDCSQRNFVSSRISFGDASFGKGIPTCEYALFYELTKTILPETSFLIPQANMDTLEPIDISNCVDATGDMRAMSPKLVFGEFAPGIPVVEATEIVIGRVITH